MSIEFSKKFPEWKNPALIYLLILIIIILTVLDIITTQSILNAGGRELNPFMAPIIQYFILIRIFVIFLIYGLAKITEKIRSGAGAFPLISSSAMFLIPVSNNLIVLGVVS